ncbi:Hypothetical protein UVM_LOCUS160 [uncultured virus]|nr:Hypothetical protein UVM_LOCUS160 [uncultured virus]
MSDSLPQVCELGTSHWDERLQENVPDLVVHDDGALLAMSRICAERNIPFLAVLGVAEHRSCPEHPTAAERRKAQEDAQDAQEARIALVREKTESCLATLVGADRDTMQRYAEAAIEDIRRGGTEETPNEHERLQYDLLDACSKRTECERSVRELVALGADPKEVLLPELGLHAVHFAAKHDRLVELQELLDEHGCDMEVRSFSGKTPLHYACMAPAPNAVACLLERGADRRARDNAGWAPFQYVLGPTEAPLERVRKGLLNKLEMASKYRTVCELLQWDLGDSKRAAEITDILHHPSVRPHQLCARSAPPSAASTSARARPVLSPTPSTSCAAAASDGPSGSKKRDRERVAAAEREQDPCGDDDEDDLCIVCCDRPANTLVVPCLHCVVCRECSLLLATDRLNAKVCVKCRQPIVAVLD